MLLDIRPVEEKRYEGLNLSFFASPNRSAGPQAAFGTRAIPSKYPKSYGELLSEGANEAR